MASLFQQLAAFLDHVAKAPESSPETAEAAEEYLQLVIEASELKIDPYDEELF